MAAGRRLAAPYKRMTGGDMADLGSIGRIYDVPGIVRLQGPIISGVVLDDAGTPAARAVTAIRRSTGVLDSRVVSREIDGTYELAMPPGTEGVERNVIVHDDDGGTLYNDIIMRVIPG